MSESIDVSPRLPMNDVTDMATTDSVLLSEVIHARTAPGNVFSPYRANNVLGERSFLRPCSTRPSFVQHVSIILGRASCPEVRRVATCSVITCMANVFIFWDRAKSKFVGHSMSTAAGRAFNHFWEPAVAFVHDVPRPGPTFFWTSASIDVTPKPGISRHMNTLSQVVTR